MTGEFVIAIHALVYLKHKKNIVSSKSLAQNICTHPARVRKIMAKLKKAGFIETKDGLKGGYKLVKVDINLHDVIQSLNEEIVSCSWYSGDSDMQCLISSGMTKLIKDIQDELNQLCLQKIKQLDLTYLEQELSMNSKKEI